jgi:membrane protein implicated in regulation of membrane protease activity
MKSSVLLKYALVQILGLVLFVVILLLLRRWLDLSMWLVGSLIFLWIIKDILLFPVFRHAYEEDSSKDEHPMIGARGVAHGRIDPSGYAWVRGELWRVEVVGPIRPMEKGEKLKVEGARGLTLLVVPDEENEELNSS